MSTLVVQPLPGIGDMVWHLPHIRAIAAHLGEPVTVLTKPRSLSDQLLAHEAAVKDVVWVDLNPGNRRGRHDGLGGFIRLVRLLRDGRYTSMLLLHQSRTIAAAGLFAGIPDRRGYGWDAQRWFLSRGPFLPHAVSKLHPNTRATKFLEAHGIPLTSPEPTFPIPPRAVAAIAPKFGQVRHPFFALGIGSSEPASRQFGPERWAAVAAALLDAGWASVVMIGGPGDAALAEGIKSHLGERAGRAHAVLGWHLEEAAAVIAQAAFLIGNNTGMMNLAAAVGIRTYCLYGTTIPFFHAPQIVGVSSPPGGPDDGMARMTVQAVLDVIGQDRGGLAPAG
jgi:heptosyltransferase II